MLTPLLFKPIYKDYLWGGDRLSRKYSRPTPSRCAESWELSDHDHGMSVVESGPWSGKTLRELIESRGESLFGKNRHYSRFPLLIKLIDARDRLSVQVHPNEKTAPLTQGDPKTEMWYALDGSPGMAVYAGLAEGTTPEIFTEHLKTGDMNSVLSRHELHPGEVVFIPGGLVHAIDRGCFLLEVQQNSDTTYRLWDWGRVDAISGKPRELHLEQAMKTVDWNNHDDPLVRPLSFEKHGRNSETGLIANDFFIMNSYRIEEPQVFDTRQRCFDVFFMVKGNVRISWDSDFLSVDEGRTVLIPASLGEYRLEPATNGPCEILYVTMPDAA